jgi:TRAP-type mannitol/chloroaromatic compound transport system permease small subunit
MSATAPVNTLDRLNATVGQAAAWLTLAMVIVTFIVVVLRYVFDIGFIWLQESVIWMHAVVFMLGAAYTLGEGGHVRVDVFYRNMSSKRQAWVDLIGVLVFLLPLCVFLGWNSIEFVTQSWNIGESSREPGGLPFPFFPILKTVILLMPITVALQGISLLLRSLVSIRES